MTLTGPEDTFKMIDNVGELNIVLEDEKTGINFGWIYIPEGVGEFERGQTGSNLLGGIVAFLTDRYHKRGLLPKDKNFQLQDIVGRHLLVARDSEGTIKGVVGLAFRERFSGLPLAEDLSEAVSAELNEQVTIPQNAIFVEVGRLSVAPEDEVSDYIIKTGAALIVSKILEIWEEQNRWELPMVLSAVTFNTPIERRNGEIVYHDPSGDIFAQLSMLLIKEIYDHGVEASANYTRVLLGDTGFSQDSLACRILMQRNVNILRRIFRGENSDLRGVKFSIKVISAPEPLSRVGASHYGGVLSLQSEHKDVLQRLSILDENKIIDDSELRAVGRIVPACAPFVAHVTIVTPNSRTV